MTIEKILTNYEGLSRDEKAYRQRVQQIYNSIFVCESIHSPEEYKKFIPHDWKCIMISDAIEYNNQIYSIQQDVHLRPLHSLNFIYQKEVVFDLIINPLGEFMLWSKQRLDDHILKEMDVKEYTEDHLHYWYTIPFQYTQKGKEDLLVSNIKKLCQLIIHNYVSVHMNIN